MNDKLSPPPGETPQDPPRGVMARVRNYFLTGLIVAGPVLITFYLITSLWTRLFNYVEKAWLPAAERP